MIEAHNKVIKYNYLYKMPLANGTELKKSLAWIQNDFNDRPHISLKGTNSQREPRKLYSRYRFLKIEEENCIRREEAIQFQESVRGMCSMNCKAESKN